MDPFLYMVIGIAIGVGIGSYAAGSFNWKRALVAGGIGVVVALAVIIFADQAPCFLGKPNCD